MPSRQCPELATTGAVSFQEERNRESQRMCQSHDVDRHRPMISTKRAAKANGSPEPESFKTGFDDLLGIAPDGQPVVITDHRQLSGVAGTKVDVDGTAADRPDARQLQSLQISAGNGELGTPSKRSPDRIHRRRRWLNRLDRTPSRDARSEGQSPAAIARAHGRTLFDAATDAVMILIVPELRAHAS